MQAIETPLPTKITRRARRIADESYRSFRLVLGYQGEQSVGVAYAGKIPVFHAEAATSDDVAADLRSQIDTDLQARLERGPHGWTVEDYSLALHLCAQRLSPVQSHILKRVAHVGDEPVHLEALIWPSSFPPDAVQRALVRTMKMISQAIDPHAGKSNAGGKQAFEVIAGGDENGPWAFIQPLRQAAAVFIGEKAR